MVTDPFLYECILTCGCRCVLYIPETVSNLEHLCNAGAGDNPKANILHYRRVGSSDDWSDGACGWCGRFGDPGFHSGNCPKAIDYGADPAKLKELLDKEDAVARRVLPETGFMTNARIKELFANPCGEMSLEDAYDMAKNVLSEDPWENFRETLRREAEEEARQEARRLGKASQDLLERLKKYDTWAPGDIRAKMADVKQHLDQARQSVREWEVALSDLEAALRVKTRG